MTDQPPPPSDKKPRRRSAPRKRAPTRRAAAADATTGEAPATSGDMPEVAGALSQEAQVSDTDAFAAKLDPQPLVDAGDRGDAPAEDVRDVTVDAGAAEAALAQDEAHDGASAQGPEESIPRPAVQPHRAPGAGAPSLSRAERTVETSQPPAASESAVSAQATAAAPFPRQAELRPGELIRVPLSVRWRDLDAFNHVNNSKYLSYLEEARLRWMLAMPGMGMDDDVAPVVAASNLNYRRPIEWPADVVIELFVERIGGSSLTIGHRIVDSKDGRTLYCDGNVVMVWIDRNSGRSAPLPESVRAACR